MITSLLVIDSLILMHGEFQVTEDTISLEDNITQKSVLPEGWQIVLNVEVPEDFYHIMWDWNGTELVPSQVAIDLTEEKRIAGLKEQIVNIEDKYPITPRKLRELVLIVRQLVLTVDPNHPAVNGLEIANQIDTAITALRSQI